MGTAKGGTKADEVHVGIDAANDAALQACVANLHLCLFVEELAIDIDHLCYDWAVEVRLPSSIVTAILNLHACHREAAFLHFLDVLHHRLATRTSQNQDACLAATNIDDAKIATRLDNRRDAGNVAKYAVVTSHDGIHEVVLNLFWNTTRRHCSRLNRQRDALFHTSELVVEDLLTIRCQLAEVVVVLHRNGQHDGSRARNGVAHVAALPRAEANLIIDNGLTDKASHQFVGIGATFIDFQAAVTSAQTLEHYLDRDVALFQFDFLILHRGTDVDTSSRANHELAHRLVVDIQQDVALQRVGRKMVHAVHAGLFVGRDEGFQRTVLDVRALHDSHDGSHADAIVAAQRRTFCFHPIAVNISLDGICLEVMIALIHLLRHHIHVSLQNCALAVFLARSGGLAHHDVLGIVLEGFNAMLLCPIEQELLYFLQVSAWTWDLRQEIKVLPNNLRIEVFNKLCHILFVINY